MLKYLKNEANLTHTENGAVTYRSTQSECLDLFATIGALRRESDEEITNRFLRAYGQAPGRTTPAPDRWYRARGAASR